MPVTINVKPRNPMPISYYGYDIEGTMTFVDQNVLMDAATQKPVFDDVKSAINQLKSSEPQEIKDAEMENIGSDSISDLTEMKHRKQKQTKD